MPASQLSSDELASWSRVQEGDCALRSPFFRPEFTQIVAEMRNDVEVAILVEDGKSVGFFPFHRGKHNVAHPVGCGLSEHQGVIVGNGVEWNIERLLQACNIRALYFDHLSTGQRQFTPYYWVEDSSHCMDLSQGFRRYREEKRRNGCRVFKRINQKSRKIEREVGPLRLVRHAYDDDLFHRLLSWKTQLHGRMPDWKIEMLHEVACTGQPSFAGVLFGLFAGDHVISLLLGIRSGSTLHGWLSGFDAAFQKYSPGLLLWERLATKAESLGIQCIDLGRGSERYKVELGSRAVRLAEGAIDLRPLLSTFCRGWWKAKEMLSESRFHRPVQNLVRSIRGAVYYRATSY